MLKQRLATLGEHGQAAALSERAKNRLQMSCLCAEALADERAC
jgi:hypothetical protein